MISPRLFLRCSLLTCVVAVFCYAAADSKPLLAIGAVFSAAGSLWLMRGSILRTLPRFAINLMVLAATANVFLQVTAVRGPDTAIISDLTDFLVFILLTKMFDRGRTRDEAQLLGLSIFVIIGSVLTSNTLLTGFFLIIYTPLAVLSVVLFQIYQGVQRTSERRFDSTAQAVPAPTGTIPLASTLLPSARAKRQLILTTAIALFASLTLAVIGFVFTPRTMADQVGGLGLARGTEVGFRDNITLGQAGGISESSEPVMDIALSDASGQIITDRREPLYLRGAVLDLYNPDTGAWSSHLPSASRRDRQPHEDSGKDRPVTLPGASAARQRLIQHISLRENRSDAKVPLFAAWRPIRVTLDAPGQVYYSPSDDVTLQRRGDRGKFEYTVESSPDAVEDVPSPSLEPFDMPRVREFAISLFTTAGISLDPAKREASDNRRAATFIENHLRNNYTYTLEMVAPAPGQDPIEMFLFDTKRGHCEYFASAMTALLRSVDLDARIITGYAGGEFNPVTGQFVIRRSDAHAWVEVRLRPERWDTFDPTPPSALGMAKRSAYFGASVVAKLRHFYEALELQWVDSVVSFSRAPKIDLTEAASAHRQRLEDAEKWLSDTSSRIAKALSISHELGGQLVLGAIIIVILFLFVSGARSVFIRVQRRLDAGSRYPTRRSEGPRIRYYESMLKTLRKAGHQKPLTLPPLLHARNIAAYNPAAAEVIAALTERYYRQRFGDGADAPDHQSLTQQLRAALSNNP